MQFTAQIIDGKVVTSTSFKQWISTLKNGTRLVMDIEAIGKDQSFNQKGFFYKGILPKVVAGFMELGEHISIREAEDRMRHGCPLLHEHKVTQEGRTSIRIKEVSELDMPTMSNFIDWCIQFTAENLGIIINNER